MIQNALDTLEQERIQLKSLSILYAAIYAVALVMIFFNTRVSAAFVAGNIAFYYGFIRPLTKRFERSYAGKNAIFGTGSVLEEPKWQPNGGLQPGEIRETGLIPVQEQDKGFLLCNCISGSFSSADIRIAEISTHYMGTAKNGRSAPQFLCGTWLDAILPITTGYDLIAADDAIAVQAEELYRRNGFSLVQDARLPQQIRLYARNGENEEQSLPASLCERLNDLKDSSSKPFAVRIQGNRISMIFINRFFTDKPLMSRPITKDMLLLNRLPERDAALALGRESSLI